MKSPYAETRKNYERAWQWHEAKSNAYNTGRQLRAFASLLRGKRVLDAGCGAGRDVQKFLALGLDVEGLDYSHSLIARCRKKFPQSVFHLGDLRKTRLSSSSFDGIWACASILNLSKSDAQNAFAEFNRLLKPGGVLMVSVKKGRGEKMVSDRAGRRFFSYYSESELKRRVENAGVRVTKILLIPEESLTGRRESPRPPDWIFLYAEKKKFDAMRLLVTGTPCVGKTTLATRLSQLLDCPLVRVNDLVDEIGCYKIEEKEGAKIVDLRVLQRRLKKLLEKVATRKENVVVEGHLLCDVRLPCEKILVLRCDPRVLEKRMKKRRWRKEKISENVLAEILDYCLINSEQNYGAKKVLQVNFTKPLAAERVLAGGSDFVDWTPLLLKNRFGKLF